MRKEKQLLLDEIKEKVDASNAFILARCTGINPNLAAEFRSELLKLQGEMTVVKKRLFRKALDEAGMTYENELPGHLAVIFTGEETIEPTKVVCKFQKDNKDLLEVLGGHFEGKFCSPAEVKQISQLPTKDEMRSQLLGLFEAPMAETLSVMEALLTSVPLCLENKASKEN